MLFHNLKRVSTPEHSRVVNVATFLLVTAEVSIPLHCFKSESVEGKLKKKNRTFDKKKIKFIAQNAYCSRDIYLQFMKYLRSAILPISIPYK